MQRMCRWRPGMVIELRKKRPGRPLYHQGWFYWWSDVARMAATGTGPGMVYFQGIGWRLPGMAGKAAREGWRLHHPSGRNAAKKATARRQPSPATRKSRQKRQEVIQQDARELLPAKSNETAGALCPGFFLAVGAAHGREILLFIKPGRGHGPLLQDHF